MDNKAKEKEIENFIYIKEIKKSKRIVIKIGSATLTHTTGKLNLKRIENLVRAISDFSNMGKEIILVSSGAVSAGTAKLGMKIPLLKIEDKKAAGAVGQAELMSIYDRFFSSFGIKIAQMLLTRDVIENETRRKNAEETFSVLMKMGCVLIINENDPVSTDELKFSGNDILAAHVSKLCKADLLINLTNRDGFYDKNPSKFKNAKLIREVKEITPEILSYAGGAGDRGTGGFVTKLEAGQMISEEKTPMIIANGKNPEILYDILEGKIAGTYIKNQVL